LISGLRIGEDNAPEETLEYSWGVLDLDMMAGCGEMGLAVYMIVDVVIANFDVLVVATKRSIVGRLLVINHGPSYL
jgi:hypothetical protein